MKKYREAKTEKEKKRGKSTDELSFKEALNFFKKRGEDKGASKFRWRGDVYNLDGDKVGSSKKTSASTNTAPKTSKRPQTPSTGNRSSSGGPARYDSTKTRMSSGPSTRRGPATDKNKTNKEVKLETVSDPVTQVEPRSSLERFKEKRKRAQEVLKQSQEDEANKADKRANAPTFREFFNNWLKENPDVRGQDRITAREEQRKKYNQMYGPELTRPTGMAKGGMVRKGNTDYKGKGMFYKSASPRGYK